MKIIRFEWQKSIKYGIVDKDTIFSIKGSIFEDFKITQSLCQLSEVRILAPVKPHIVVGVGGNYRSVIEQAGNEIPKEPQLFIRPASTVIGHLDKITYPKTSHIVNFGSELTIIIKHNAWNVNEDKALDYILGYTCGFDMTAFDLLKADNFKQMRGKSFPTSQPLGPYIATGIDGDNIRIRSRLNGDIIEDGSTFDLIFKIRQLVSYISRYILLEPGDAILTGQMRTTEVHIGDTIEVNMEGIGTLKNTVVSG